MPHDSQQEVRESLFTDWLPKLEEVAPEQNAILEEHRDFVASIQTARQPKVCGRQGLRALEVAHQILDEIRHHAWYGQALPIQGPLAIPFPRIINSGEFGPAEAQRPFPRPERRAG